MLRVASRIFRTEWTEAPGQWPHCCTQAGCWMHTDRPWCGCRCGWCRLAKLVRRGRA